MLEQEPRRKRRNQPTLKSIAERTGLAITTVSKALRGGGNLNAETVKRVHAVAREIGYRPNRSGVGLRTGRTFVITVAVDHSDDISDFERRIVTGVSTALSATPYEMSFTPIFAHTDEIEVFRDIATSHAADGIIFTNTTPDDKRVKLLTELDFPFVTHGRTNLAVPHAYYDFDNEAFVYQAAKRLIQKGRKNLAIASGTVGLTYFEHAKAGLHRATQEEGAKVSTLNPAEGVKPFAAAMHEAVLRAANNHSLPDGIISSSDIGSLALIDALIESDVIIGKDIDIVSRRTSTMLDFCRPRLDMISEDLIGAGEVLAKLLIRRINGEAPEDLQMIGAPKVMWQD